MKKTNQNNNTTRAANRTTRTKIGLAVVAEASKQTPTFETIEAEMELTPK